MISLNWRGFDLAVEYLAARIAKKGNVTAIYAVPRGGLVLGVALSNLMRLPMVNEPEPGAVVVDDIIDTGETIRDIRARYGARLVAAWIVRSRADVEDCIASSLVDHDEWFLFPWEREDYADEDERRFNASRERTV
jgi:xanthine phosphoribosyltransferase